MEGISKEVMEKKNLYVIGGDSTMWVVALAASEKDDNIQIVPVTTAQFKDLLKSKEEDKND